MVIKMPLCQCDIDITGLADRLAIIERFQNCKQARVLLQQPGQPIENFGAGVPALGFPYRARADAIAASISAVVPRATCVKICPLMGDKMSIVLPSDAGTCLPSMRWVKVATGCARSALIFIWSIGLPHLAVINVVIFGALMRSIFFDQRTEMQRENKDNDREQDKGNRAVDHIEWCFKAGHR